LNNKTIRYVVILGAFAIILILAVQGFLMRETWTQKDKDLDRTVKFALTNVAKDISVISRSILPAQNLINRDRPNYYIVNVNTQIDANNLDFYLRKEFEQVSLNEDYEYGIYDCHTNEIAYINYVSSTSSERDSSSSNRDLPKYDKAKDQINYYFVVRFPKRMTYLLSTMSLTILFLVILLITILFFVYSLLVILRQKRLSELQKDFINNMTHEFKTPISTIKVSAEVFASHPMIQNDARLLKYVSIIKEQNTRLNNQVEKVLQITKIDKRNLELNLETINLQELIDAVIPSIQVKVDELKGSLNLQLYSKNPIIRADTLHLTNILHNLLDNAIKYCQGVPDICVSTLDRNNQIMLIIEDKGIGIEKEYQKRVFDRFYRVPTGDIHNVKGFGLGLYYVRNICKGHGWEVNMTSELGKGTRMAITMPREL
jgi:two-component system, OmpR family, phosphate regulon sensor histidine kinase PhoR